MHPSNFIPFLEEELDACKVFFPDFKCSEFTRAIRFKDVEFFKIISVDNSDFSSDHVMIKVQYYSKRASDDFKDSKLLGTSFSDCLKAMKALTRKVITLCGSSRFKKEFEDANRDLSLKGYIVISLGLFGHLEGLDMNGEDKKNLDALHFAKIDISDAIFVINKDKYIDESTRNEIEYARKTQKEVLFLEEI